jgi:hypothetical protein
LLKVGLVFHGFPVYIVDNVDKTVENCAFQMKFKQKSLRHQELRGIINRSLSALFIRKLCIIM